MRISVMFETKAIVPSGAPSSWDLPYLNLVVSGTTKLSPQELLKTLKTIEKNLGRDFLAPRWAPRIIDLDILAFDDQVIEEENLQIPHKEFLHRPFLVHLMASLKPDWHYPGKEPHFHGLSLAEIIHHHRPPQEAELRCFNASLQFVGIVNITPDSFSDGGKYLEPEAAMQRIWELAAQGAAVIDLGAQSTRPGASPLSSEEEWKRLEPVLNLVRQEFKNHPAIPQISLDSYDPEVIEKALSYYPIDWINDVSGGENTDILKLAAHHSCKIVLMHSLTVPASKLSTIPFEKHPMTYCLDWAERKMRTLASLGIAKEKIIFDPGIGFGKTPLQSVSLLHAIKVLKNTGCEILVGHSRKSFLNLLTNTIERDFETIGISHFLSRQGVDYLRVHHVGAHQKSLSAATLLENMHACKNL